MPLPPIAMRTVMMGTGTFARPTFQALLQGGHQVLALVTQPDRVVGQTRGSTRLAERGLKEIALERGIAVLQPENINTWEGAFVLRGLQPELLVVAAYGQILSHDVLASAALGGINVHASLLPKYRGAAPIAWAIYHGETTTGVTIIRMSIRLDAGDILAQEAIDILPNETAGELEIRLGPLGARLALETIGRLAAGPVAGKPQDKSQATKAPKLTKEMGLIDWSRPAASVCNQVRAMSPWPTAYTYLHSAGQPPLRMIVHEAAASATPPPDLACAAAFPCGDELGVACGQGSAVVLRSLQPAGKRRMTAVDFLRGRRLQAGDRFGPESP
jgi:methionyl-tRNA formyltransferase